MSAGNETVEEMLEHTTAAVNSASMHMSEARAHIADGGSNIDISHAHTEALVASQAAITSALVALVKSREGQK